jgi:hypothetical protein
MVDRSPVDIAAVMLDGEVVDRAIARARADLVRLNRKLGLPLLLWQDGRVVEVPAAELETDVSPLQPDEQ